MACTVTIATSVESASRSDEDDVLRVGALAVLPDLEPAGEDRVGVVLRPSLVQKSDGPTASRIVSKSVGRELVGQHELHAGHVEEFRKSSTSGLAWIDGACTPAMSCAPPRTSLHSSGTSTWMAFESSVTIEKLS